MLKRVSGEFETVDMAEITAGRIKNTIKGIKRIGIIYNHEATAFENIESKIKFTLLPTAVTSQNYITGIIEGEMTEDTIEEPRLRQTACLYVICNSERADNIKSFMLASGGTKIKISNS